MTTHTDNELDAAEIARAFRQMYSAAMKVSEVLSRNEYLNGTVPTSWPLTMSAEEFAHECAAMADHYDAVAQQATP
jgi:hypothetical protein